MGSKLTRRRDMMKVSGDSLYTYINYIESDGTTGSHINTGLKAYANTGIEIKFNPAVEFNTTHHVICGSCRETTSNNTGIDMYTPADATGNGTIYTGTSNITANFVTGDNEVKLHGTTCNVNGTDYTVTRQNLSYNYNLYLFAELHQSSTRYRCAGRIYYVKIYRGDTLVGDLVPVINNDTQEYGFLNKVTDTFLTNTNITGG